MRDIKGFPLPSVSTLNERARNFPCEPGVLASVLSLMKANGESLTVEERLAVMSFDEMSITKQYSYDKGTDTSYGPHGKVLVFMVRGLIGKWRQPIFYDFDRTDVHEMIMGLIKEVENASYPVVAIVHDLGTTNPRL